MSIQQLHPEGRFVDAIATAGRAVSAARGFPVTALGTDQLADGISQVAELEAQLGAMRMSLMAEADKRSLARSLGATGTDAWVARLTGSTRAAAARAMWLAGLLADKYDATREAFAVGAINEAQARVIVTAAERLPAAVEDVARREAETALVARAAGGMDARRLRQRARRMLDEVSAEQARRLADEHEAAQLEEEEARAERETWLTLGDNGDGTWSGRFVIPELHGQMLRAALDRLTSPRGMSKNAAGEPVEDESVGGRHNYNGLSWTERQGLGLTELIEHLPTSPDGIAGGFTRNAATLLVRIDYEHLLDKLGSAGLDAGVRISASAARRLACNAGLVPAVLGGASQPLDLGRESRLHNTSQRRALSLLHDTCATEGCERPFAWCDIHHPHPWSRGGRTDLDNGVPLCGWHHRRAHDDQFELCRLPSGELRFRRRRR
jgi:hypothetical protein